MRRIAGRIAVYGATDSALALLPALARRGDLALAWVYDPDARALRRRLAFVEPGAARLLQQALTDDPRVPAHPAADLALVIDGGLAGGAPPPGAVSPALAAARLALAPAPWREPSAPARALAPPAAGDLPAALARAIGEGRRFALLRCDVAGGDDHLPPSAQRERVRRRIAASLRSGLAPGELLARDRDGALVALLALEAGADPGARLLPLARAAAEQVAKELAEASPRTPLVFGYAVHPDEARGAEELLARTARARIRML